MGTKIQYRGLQHYFNFFGLGCSETLANKCGECLRFLGSIKLLKYLCSRLILFRVNCFTGNSSRNKKICSIKTTKKSSAEQKPQSKVISITRLQTNKLLVASQRVVSRESKSCKLRVYHIASQLIMSLSHFQLHANKPVSCKPVSL